MATVNKEITINAPLEKIFSYLSKPSNLQQIWPSLMVIKNEQLLPNGGYSAQWVFKMGGKLLEGTGECIDIVPNQWLTIKTSGAVESAITYTVRAKEGQTRVTLSIDYRVPSALLSWLAGRIIIKINEQEADLILANLRAILEEF
jgi:ligand-binding SRPBCC domain-containing protein